MRVWGKEFRPHNASATSATKLFDQPLVLEEETMQDLRLNGIAVSLLLEI